MAVTKIKPIRGTVNKALAYILDPEKTDDQLYVSSFGCAASDAAAKEFEVDTKSRCPARNADAEGDCPTPDSILRHRRSHAGDAHEIGKQFADEWLKGKYEYVIATMHRQGALP